MSIDERKRIADILLAAVAAAAFGWVAVQRRSGATLKFDLGIRGRVHDLGFAGDDGDRARPGHPGITHRGITVLRDRVLAAHAAPGAARIGIYVAAALLIAGIGLSRVYLGVHYPSDVIAGCLAAAFVIGAMFAFSPG